MSRVFSDGVSYIVLRGRWCNIIVQNVQSESQEKSDDSKAVFMRSESSLFYHLPKFHMLTELVSGSYVAWSLGNSIRLRLLRVLPLWRT